MLAARRPPRPAARTAPLAVTLVVMLAACAGGADLSGTITGPPATTLPGAPAPSPSPAVGVVTGSVVDTRGNPLAGVQVIADNTLFYNTNAVGVTDAQGRYRIDVGQPVGTWHMTAHLRREFEGRTYDLSLHPDNDAPFAGTEGAVRNFRWRLTGARADGLGFYGGTVQFLVDPQGWAADAHQTDVELTFTPVGPLIDGSTGQTLTLRANQGLFTIRDVPLGKYAITARYAPEGAAPRPMVLRWYGQGRYVEAFTATWPVRDATQYPDLLDLQVTAPQE